MNRIDEAFGEQANLLWMIPHESHGRRQGHTANHRNGSPGDHMSAGLRGAPVVRNGHEGAGIFTGDDFSPALFG